MTSSEPTVHSPKGASSAYRWKVCAGSVELIRELHSFPQTMEEEEPDYRKDGIEAHRLGAWCLEHNAGVWSAPLDQFPSISPEMAQAVQVYVEYVQARASKAGKLRVETRLHRPEIDIDAYGTLDAIVLKPEQGIALEVIDYKHGEGIYVAADNWQTRYYGVLEVGIGGPGTGYHSSYKDDEIVKLTIVQPRLPWLPPGENIIRSLCLTVGDLRRWAKTELMPAMKRAGNEFWLEIGEHCRFCPAKIVCPAMNALGKKAVKAPDQVTWKEWQAIKMLGAEIEKRSLRQALAGHDIEGAKLVPMRINRQWKTGGPEALIERFGDGAYQPRELLSPAMVEGLPADEAKQFVAQWAFQPVSDKLVLRPLADPHPAKKPKTPEEIYGLTKK
jgi:hypothetical protein